MSIAYRVQETAYSKKRGGLPRFLVTIARQLPMGG